MKKVELIINKENIYNEVAVTPEFDAFDHQLKRTVINKVCTPSVYTESRGKEDMLTIDRFSGLSTYIIGSSSYNDYVYSMTEWYIDCYGN